MRNKCMHYSQCGQKNGVMDSACIKFREEETDPLKLAILSAERNRRIRNEEIDTRVENLKGLDRINA